MLRSSAGQAYIRLLSGQVGRLFIQLLYFVLLARFLGPSAYGEFATVTSILLVLSTFSSVGAEALYYKYVAYDPSTLSTITRTVLGNFLISGPVVFFAAYLFLVLAVVSAVTPLALAGVCVSELFCLRISNAIGAAHFAMERVSHSVLVQLSITLSRLVAVCAVLLFFPKMGLVGWCYCYAVANLITTGVMLAQLGRELQSLAPIFSSVHLKEGFFFSLANASNIAYVELDKPLIAHFLSFAAAGTYAAAARITDAAAMPTMSFAQVMITRFFREGSSGISHSVKLARRTAPVLIGLGLLVFVALNIVAPFVGLVLGPKFASTGMTLHWLSVMPLLIGLFYLIADVLSSTGKQATRSLIQFGCVMLKLPMSVFLIQFWGYRGALGAVVVSSLLLVTATGTIVVRANAAAVAPVH